jgi:ABC-type polysaccharide/polyol phosphate transport system ATPase subunit
MTVRLVCSSGIFRTRNTSHDEVLAVGDAEFQKSHWEDAGYSREGGRTVLFVSHTWLLIKVCVLGIVMDKMQDCF